MGKAEKAAEKLPLKTTFSEPSRPIPEPPRGEAAIPSQQPDKIRYEPVSKSYEKVEEITPPTRHKTRIVSYGQPRILPPHSMQSPLTMEIDGLSKKFSINLEINIEQL